MACSSCSKKRVAKPKPPRTKTVITLKKSGNISKGK